ncbi:hypothetical protein HYU12_04660 [Candidatus Woesearchaeota archaeon]|nr:hypothetical protein [Candidatus Woesearchaeota archaeon]
MKITIDTKEDSNEEIKKLIALLTSLMEQGSMQAAEPQPIVGEGIFSMFEAKTEQNEQATLQSTQQNSTTKAEEEQPRIVLY